MAGRPPARKRRGRGEGTLEHRGGNTWRLRVYIGRDPVTGRVRQVSRTVHVATKTEALRQLRQLAAEADSERATSSEASVAHLFARWQETPRFADLRPLTRQDYTRVIANHLGPALGRIELRKLSAYHIDSYLAGKQAAGLKPKTLRLHLSILSGALGQAVKWGWIPANPAKSASPPKVEAVRRFTPEVDEVRRLIVAAGDDHELATAVVLAAITGCRRGELCGLRWSDVNWATGVLTVERQRLPVRGGDVTGPLKSKDSKRVALGPLGVAVLERYRALTATRAVELGVEVPADGWLLSRDCGWTPMAATGLGTRISQLGRRVGVPVTPHAFRRFAATQMVAAGVDVVTAASRLGHNPEMLLRVYAAPLLEPNRLAGHGLERLVLGDDKEERQEEGGSE